MSALRHLDASFNRLESFPEHLSMASLQHLYLSDNHIEDVPDSISKLSGLKVLALRHNALVWISEELGSCSELNELHLQDNELRFLPPTLSELNELSLLRLSGNKWIQPIADQLRLGVSHVVNYIGGKTYRIVYQRHQHSERRRCTTK